MEEMLDLCDACEAGNLQKVQEFIEKGSDVNKKYGYADNTALHLAKTGEIARVLLKNGAKANARNYSEGLCTPLHYAETAEVVTALVAYGAEVNATDKLRRTPLHWAQRSEVVRALLHHGAKVNAVDSKGKTALHWAENEEVVDLLIKWKADINIKDNDGNNPIHKMCALGRDDCVQRLLNAGCETVARNLKGETPMDIAKANGNYRIVDILQISMPGRGCLLFSKNRSRLQYLLEVNVCTDIPAEIRNMNDLSVKIFCKALKSGKRKMHEIRLMVVGHFGAGKTTFTLGLLQDNIPRSRVYSTNGVEIYIGRCIVDLETMKWIYTRETFEEIQDILKKMADVLSQIKQSDISSTVKTNNLIDEKKNALCVTNIDYQQNHPKGLVNGMDTVDGFTGGLDTVDGIGIDTVDSVSTEPQASASVGYDTVDSSLIKISINESNIEDVNQPPMLSARKMKRHLSYSPEDLLKQTLDHAKERKEVKNCAPVQVWDFGGQAIFYTTHQTFLSARCVYTLVIDVSRKLLDCVEDTHLHPGSMMKSKIIEFIRFWVNSIISYARGEKRGFPKIIIIGTHIDQLPVKDRTRILEELFLEIRREFMNHPASEHLIIDPRFCLNALDHQDPGYNMIRTEIFRIAKLQPYWGEERPTSWLPLEEVFSSLRKNGVKVLSLEDVNALNEASPVHEIPSDELKYFLLFQHSLGNILYFDEDSIRNFIILDPRWLIHALKSIITAEIFCKHDHMKRQIWTSLSGQGVVHISSLLQLWKRKENEEFFKNKDHLLKVLEKIDLIAKPKLYTSDGNDMNGTFYFVPSMLKDGIGGKKIEEFIPVHRTAVFVIAFKRKFLPPAIFQRLVASCLSMWPVLQFRKENALFSGFAGYKLDSYHHLFLRLEDHKIIVSVTHLRFYKGICHMLCSGVRFFITSALCRIVDTYSECFGDEKSKTNLVFDIHVPCCQEHPSCLLNLDEIMTLKPLCQHHYSSSSAELIRYIWYYSEMPESLKRRPCDNKCNGPPKDMLECRLLEAELGRLGRVIVAQPYMLFNALDIPEQRGNAIINDHRDDINDQKYYILSEWFRRKRNPTYESLINDLAVIGESRHIYCQIYKEEYSTEFKDEDLEQIPSDMVIDQLSDRFCKESFQLGIELGMDHVALEALKERQPDPLKRNRDMLKLWKNEGKFRPTIRKLVSALDKVGIYSSVLKTIMEPTTDAEDDWS